MREKIFNRTLFCLCAVIMACGTAANAQSPASSPAGGPIAQAGGKIASGPYQGKAPMAPMAAPDAVDAVIYSNLTVDTCTGCNYSSQNGYFILGPSNCFAPGATQWIAYPFVAGRTQAVTRVSLSITDYGVCVSTSKRFTVAIYTDNCANVPDTQIGLSVIAQAPAAPCALASANFGAAGVSVAAGTKYWVVVTTSTAPTQMGTTAVWWMANSAYAPFNLNDGNGWINFPDGAPGGFQVQ